MSDKLYIHTEEDTTTIEDTRGCDGDEYSGFRRDHRSVKVKYISADDDNGYYVEEVDNRYDFKTGDVGYLVAVIYTTGGTFSSTSGYAHFEAVCKTLEEAEELRDLIIKDNDYYQQNHSRRYDKSYQALYKPKTYKAWQGYFESLDDVEIIKFTVRSNSKKHSISYEV